MECSGEGDVFQRRETRDSDLWSGDGAERVDFVYASNSAIDHRVRRSDVVLNTRADAACCTLKKGAELK